MSENVSGNDVEEIRRAIMLDSKPYVQCERKANRIRVRFSSGAERSLPFDEELCNELQSLAREVRERSSTTPPKGTGSVPREDIQLYYTAIKGKRPLVEQLVSKLSWLQTAITDIGSETLLIMLLASGESPDRIGEVVSKFGDPEKLVSYVREKLLNFIVSATNPQQVEELRGKLAETKLSLALCLEDNEKLRYSNQALWARLRQALSIMTASELRKLMEVMILESYIQAGIKVSEETVEGGGEVGGEQGGG
ncbi:MAG: hypothetical protein LZ174_10335 [Thaumarchaeota archaeon]|jgi:hypothetical protein|nr:hypothetical protein [Candidatus Geocrenenecus arthurdayi]